MNQNNVYSNDWKPFLDLTADETVAVIQESGGVVAPLGKNLRWLTVANLDAVDYFLQLFDESDAVVLGTTLPKYSLPLVSGDGTLYGLSEYILNMKFDNKMQYAITTTASGLTGPSTDLILNAAFE